MDIKTGSERPFFRSHRGWPISLRIAPQANGSRAGIGTTSIGRGPRCRARKTSTRSRRLILYLFHAWTGIWGWPTRSRSERPARRGRIDDSGGDVEGGKKLYYHLTLLAEDNTGYRNLIQLASRAFMEGYYYKPRVDWETLAEHSQGLIATTGCLGGHVLQSLMQGDMEGAVEKAGRLQDIFGRDNLFVEIQDHGIPEQHKTNPQLLEIARRIKLRHVPELRFHYDESVVRGQRLSSLIDEAVESDRARGGDKSGDDDLAQDEGGRD